MPVFDGAALTGATSAMPRACRCFAVMWIVGVNVWLGNSAAVLREWHVRLAFLRRQAMELLPAPGWRAAWARSVARMGAWSPPVRLPVLLFGSGWLFALCAGWLWISYVV